jgi:hypothetical protein
MTRDLVPANGTPTSPFEEARARWRAAEASFREVLASAEGWRAVALLDRPETADDAVGDHGQVLRDRAERVLQGQPARPRSLRRKLEEVEDAPEEARVRLTVEAAAWERARDAEALRVAQTLRPRHQAAVRQLAACVEALSKATLAERAVREEFQAAGLAPLGSVLLPDCSSGLLGTLDDFDSTASAWGRRMLQIGAAA